MAFSTKRKIGAKRRVKRAVGLEGLTPNLLPEVPSFRSIIRQLLAGLLARTSRRQKIKRQYKLTEITQITQVIENVQQAFTVAAYQSTIQSAIHVLGEMIYSTPIQTSSLAQAWQLTRRKSGVFVPAKTRLTYEAIFAKAVAEAQTEIHQVMVMVRRGGKQVDDIDLQIINPAPYLDDARPRAYWDAIMTNAWQRQAIRLQKEFDRNASKLGL